MYSYSVEESRINLCICAVSVLLYLLVCIRGCVKLRRKKRTLEGEGGQLPPPDKKFVPSIVASAVLLALPFLVYFKPYITAVLAGCAVLGLYITFRDRLGEGKD